MFNDRAGSRLLSQMGRSMFDAGNQMRIANGQAPESMTAVALKGIFWQFSIWKWLRSRMRAEQALLLLPIAILATFFITSLIQGLFGADFRADFEPVSFYLFSTLIFWGIVLAVSLSVAIALESTKLIRKFIWWIRRG